MRLIDADALIEEVDGALTDSIAEGYAIEKIMDAPTINAVPVMQCKDCTRYQTEKCFMHIERLWELTPDDFCSRAERQEVSE